MPDQTLGIILQATAQNAAAFDQMIAKNEALKSSSSDLNVIYGAQGQVLSDLSGVMGNASASHEKHTGKVKEAAAAERDLTKEGGEAARAMSALGRSGAEVFDRFSSLAGMMGSGGGLGIGIGVALVGFGALIEGSKKVSETYQEQQTSIQSLRQATDATHQSFETLNKTFEDWSQQNAQFIPNINTARDDIAAFTRAGFDAKTAMEAENVTIDLAAIKHEDLATAGKQVLLMMEGQGKIAKQLGIDIKALANSDADVTKANKDLETTTKEVGLRQEELTRALRSQKEEEDALAGKRKLSQHDLDILQDKANAVKTAQENLTKALQGQKGAQDAANNSMQTSALVLDQLSVKTDKGRQNYTDLEKQQNANSAAWDDFASRTGPAVNDVFLVITGTLNGLIQLLDLAAQGIQWLGQHAGDVPAALAAAPSAGAPNIGRTGVRAAGGPVYPGSVYTVGEAGPETLVMGASGGYVVPNGGGQSGGQTVNVYITQTDPDPVRIAREIAWAMKTG